MVGTEGTCKGVCERGMKVPFEVRMSERGAK